MSQLVPLGAAAGVVGGAAAVVAAAWGWESEAARSVAGGAVIGAATVFFMAMAGRIAGYSGIIYNAVTFKKGDWLWRWVFLSGTVAAGAVLHGAGLARAFAPLPVAGQWTTIALSGMLVGYGTVLGGGCTSGHGVCGMSRLSKRSIANTLTFMAAGACTATLTPLVPASLLHAGAAAALGAGIVVSGTASHRAAHPTAVPSPKPAPRLGETRGGSSTSSSANWTSIGRLPALAGPEPTKATSASATAGSGSAAGSVVAQLRNWRELVLALASGTTFGVGLGVSTMTNPAAVLQFLRLDAATWSPNLMLVMGTALAVAVSGNYVTFRRAVPVCGPIFHLPSETKITQTLLAGGALFGVGWGLAGLCPGPAVVSLVLGSADYNAWFAAMVCGMWAYYGVTTAATHVGKRSGASAMTIAAAVQPVLNPFTSTANLFDGLPPPSSPSPVSPSAAPPTFLKRA